MHKTPDEIKSGLKCCTIPLCAVCPYDGEESCIEKNNEDALTYIQQLEAKVPRWISVEERLPETRGTYIAHIVHRYNKADSYSRMCIEYFDTEDMWTFLHDVYEVTHWMPLPEPPEV